MSLNWVGSLVSIDCGDVLGTYQGQVKSIDDGENTLTITKAFRNGLKTDFNDITICARDVKDLKIVKTPVEASKIIQKQATPSKLSKQISDHEFAEPVPVKEATCVSSSPEQNGVSNHLTNGYSLRRTPNKDRVENGYHRNGNGYHLNNSYPRSPVKDDSNSDHGRRNSDSRGRKASTPRKIEGGSRRKNSYRENCFSAPVDCMLADFDFEKNLALFDKKAVFQEIESTMPSVIKPSDQMKYRCDENVIQSGPVLLQQIKVPQKSGGRTYYTDSGLTIPSISYDLREKLFSSAEKSGFSQERQIEMVGRSGSEMVLQLLGGVHRLTPQNNHQKPTVVVLCGPHKQGAEGVNCARQLANHNVTTIVFVPNFVKMNHNLEKELELYDLCDGIKTTSTKDLPSQTIDMIVNAMDNNENTYLREQSWYKTLVEWANQNRAPVVAIDPPVNGSSIQAKWCLGICLPLSWKFTSTQVYLCDLGFPRKLFTELGITFVSPFGHKFVIPIHENS